MFSFSFSLRWDSTSGGGESGWLPFLCLGEGSREAFFPCRICLCYEEAAGPLISLLLSALEPQGFFLRYLPGGTTGGKAHKIAGHPHPAIPWSVRSQARWRLDSRNPSAFPAKSPSESTAPAVSTRRALALALCLQVRLSLQIPGGQLALKPHFSDDSKKSRRLSLSSFFGFCCMKWWLLNSLELKAAPSFYF